DIEEWLGELVRQVDSSLLDEWEKLRHPEDEAEAHTGGVVQSDEQGPTRVTANRRAFRVQVRNALFRRVELAARQRYTELAELDGVDGWDAEEWSAALDAYFAEHEELGSGPNARGPHLLLITEEEGR